MNGKMSTTVAASKKATAKRRKSAKDDYSTQLLLVGDFLCSALWCATSSTFAQARDLSLIVLMPSS